jgi:hypothetical protein
MLWDENERLIALDDAYPIFHGMYLIPEFYSEVAQKSLVIIIYDDNLTTSVSILSDDDGREVRRVHLDVAQECDSGDPEEK